MSNPTNFYMPGDTVKAKNESRRFHRDMTYEVSHCIAVPGGIEVYIRDKYGDDVLLGGRGDVWVTFERTAKTETLHRQRYLLAAANFMFNSGRDQLYESFLGWKDDKKLTIQYICSRAIFMSNRDAVCRVDKTQDGKTNEFYFNSKQEFEDYMTKEIDSLRYGFNPVGMTHEAFSILTEYSHLFNNPHPTDNSVLKLKTYEQIPYVVQFDVFKQYLNAMIFDLDKTTDDTNDLINDILKLYRDLPSSHSATSVSKILMGKSKIKNQKIDHLIGKWPKILKQPQMFELANQVETYLYRNKIVGTKEEYSSGTEWRGQFEFIGSKWIDTQKMNNLIY